MKLELASFPVKDVRFGKQTIYNNGVLEVNKEELIALALEDNKIASANLELVFPNDQTRIALVRDAVEPRVKVSGPGCVFPGILGPIETVGEGRTHRLSGVAVITSAKYRPTMTEGFGAQNSSFLDLWGPGSLISPLGSIINMILILQLIDNVTELEAHTAIQLAEFKVANRLAEATMGKVPESLEVFELSEVDPSLPRVVYILGARTGFPNPHTGTSFYGMPIEASLPTLVHPNEFLDGAVTVDVRQGSAAYTTTWGWMNQPMVLELLREHGKRLNFLGVILQRTRFEAEPGKKVTAAVTSQMARLLGADGAIYTGTVPSGNNFMDLMFTVEACEKKGVKVVFVTPDWGSTEDEPALPFYVPEAISMVSTGVIFQQLKLPKPAKAIAVEKGERVALYMPEVQLYSPWDEVTLDWYALVTYGIDWWGGMNYTCKEY